jgi:hypothetical protein
VVSCSVECSCKYYDVVQNGTCTGEHPRDWMLAMCLQRCLTKWSLSLASKYIKYEGLAHRPHPQCWLMFGGLWYPGWTDWMGSLRAECPKGDTDFFCCPKLRRARENSAEAMMQIEWLPEGDSQRFAGGILFSSWISFRSLWEVAHLSSTVFFHPELSRWLVGYKEILPSNPVFFTGNYDMLWYANGILISF